MGLTEGILLYATMAVFAVVIGALVAGACWVIASVIEAVDDIKKHGW